MIGKRLALILIWTVLAMTPPASAARIATSIRWFEGSFNGLLSGYPFSVVAWVYYWDDLNQDMTTFAISKSSASNVYWQQFIQNGTAVGAVSGVNTTWHGAGTTAAVSKSAWHNLICVYPGAGSMTIYLDGNHVNTYSAASTPWSTELDTITIGELKTTSDIDHFSNALADVCVWSCELSAADITSVQTYAPGHVHADKVVAWWRLNEANATDNAVDEKSAHALTRHGDPSVVGGPSLNEGYPSTVAAAAVYHFRSEQ